MKEIPEKIQLLLKQVSDHFDQEDRSVRERQIRQWKRMKYFWAGFQQTWYSEVAHDWRIWDQEAATLANDNSFYDKPVNIFRAYLESIIAALSIAIPTLECFPDDADNPQDLATAKAGNKIADLIAKHNDVSLLWLHSLFIYCTEGMVGCYTYTKEDYKYGEYSEPKYDDIEETRDQSICPTCGTEIDPGISNQLNDEFAPDNSDVPLHDLLSQNDGNFCPKCMAAVTPEITQKKFTVTRMVGITSKPKSRQCMEVYGGLYIKVANYALKQCDTPYLMLCYETHYSDAIERYPNLRDKFTKQSKIGPGSGGMYDPYERWGRISTQYYGEYPINTTTIRNCWLRPSSFNVLNDEDDVKLLKKHFPDGAKVVFVNDMFAEAENECLDDCWTLVQNPLSDYIHFDPLGLLLVSVQEITNDLISLILQTIEHGIPQTFATPDVVNFEAYKNSEVTVGAIVPTKQSTGKNIGDSFYTVKTASLSAEVLPFAQQVQEVGQLVSGALPSLFGGVQAGGGKTAAQYSMSRAQAQQRLGTTWKMFNIWWKNIFGKAIPAYIKELKDDEKFVEKDESGNFINVFIRKAELEGKIGSVELESSDQLPSTWAQKKDVIMQLLQATNPEVMAALTSPENIPLLAQAIGLDDFEIPGGDDREKQYEEIQLLVQSAPIPQPDGTEGPSINIEPDVDNNGIEADICRRWLVSPAGRLCKTENPDGYRNVLLHLKQHVAALQPPVAPPNSASGPSVQGNQQGNGPGKVIPMAASLPKGMSNAAQ